MRWGIRLRNNHPNIKTHEVKAIVGEIQKVNDLLYIFEGNIDLCLKLINSSAAVKEIISEPLIVELSNIHNIVNRLEKKNGSFMVSIEQIGEKTVSIRELQGKIGKQLIDNNRELFVDLTEPQNVLRGYIFDQKLFIGWLFKSIKFDIIDSGAPRRSPYFGGGNMKPHLSRICVNLTRNRGKLAPVILDPFSGHGGILREIARLGSWAIGFEIKFKVILESRKNNEFYNLSQNIELINADALKPPLRKRAINAIVTDPPYALQTTTMGIDPEELITNWLKLYNTETITIVITTPSTVMINNPADWKVDINELDYVHRSLSRRIRRFYH